MTENLKKDAAPFMLTAVAVCIIFAIGLYTPKLSKIPALPQKPPLTLTVTISGYQWWWQADFNGFTTANEIHIPVGVPVLLKLKSMDVAHSFWVPALVRKTKMIPGIVSQRWIKAKKPGVYHSECAECGPQHAHMSLDIVAQDMPAFQAWEERQKTMPQQPAGEQAAAGQNIFMNNCAACHTIRGTPAVGIYAPDLTHLQSRSRIAAGLMTNTPKHLKKWIAHAQELKPGSLMPDIGLSADEVSALTDYLSTLK
jgi:cytochrome c oxidase subunit 2